MKVDFLVVGAQKAGTSALDYYLRAHPEIAMANVKEVHFFDNEELFSGQSNYPAYHRCFTQPLNGEEVIFGESTPIYMYWEPSIARIWNYNPNIKLIAVLRNPIERAYSQWNMERDRGLETLPFGEAIRMEAERCRQALPYQHRVFSYLDRGFYSAQIRKMLRFFPQEQILLIKYEDLRNQPAETMANVFGFLGVRPDIEVEQENIHSRAYPEKLLPEDRDFLRDVFRYEVKQLEQMLDWDCSDWLS